LNCLPHPVSNHPRDASNVVGVEGLEPPTLSL
jgi:hypothetical protein